MSQEDFDITKADANTGTSFRAAVNNALQALASCSSGASTPTTTYPFQLWADTTTNQIKQRNSTNDGWNIIGPINTDYFGHAVLIAANIFTATQMIKGTALMFRFNDRAGGGKEWAVRSLTGVLQICENTGTEGAPVWTVRGTVNSTGFLGDGSQLTGIAGFPVGGCIDWPTETPPSGFLEENGASLSRTTYSALFAVIGTMYGFADSTHFNLRDCRGRFKRYWDHGIGRDPDRAARTNRGDGTTGDHVGTIQTCQYSYHAHPHNHSYDASLVNANFQGGPFNAYQGHNTGSTSTDATASGGNEDRPLNINSMSIIKY